MATPRKRRAPATISWNVRAPRPRQPRGHPAIPLVQRLALHSLLLQFLDKRGHRGEITRRDWNEFRRAHGQDALAYGFKARKLKGPDAFPETETIRAAIKPARKAARRLAQERVERWRRGERLSFIEYWVLATEGHPVQKEMHAACAEQNRRLPLFTHPEVQRLIAERRLASSRPR